MRLESCLKHFNPKGVNVNRVMSHSELTSTDIMAALGITKQRAGFGLSLFLGKQNISSEDKSTAIKLLAAYAIKQLPACKKDLASIKAILIIAKMAFAYYYRSAETVNSCDKCNGRGIIISRDKQQMQVHCLCVTCHGKGVISNRCRCHGTGEVADREKSRLQGIPIKKTCPRCLGRGYRKQKSVTVYRALKTVLPKLTETTYRRKWKPLYDMLIARCYKEESHADTVFNRVTN